MHPRATRPVAGPVLFLPLLLAVPALVGLPAAAADERSTHPDGSVLSKVPLNAKGERDGAYAEYFPGGKKVHVRARYRKGQLDGVRETFDEMGNRTGEEQWVAGRLVFPKSPRMIEAARARIMRESTAAVAAFGKSMNPNAPPPDMLAKALGRLNTVRYLCDVPADVTLSQEQVNLCQYGAELLTVIGKLNHDPPQPAGYPDESFKLGHEGCAKSNLFKRSGGGGGDPVASIDSYLDDSDADNISRVGHRRWMLNPRMGTTGFGRAGDFSAMYSIDDSRREVPDYDVVCFPPRGSCPANLFGPRFAWHASLNPAKYTVNDDAKMSIYVVDPQHLTRRGGPLELDYSHVDRSGIAIPNAIIARPKDFSPARTNLLFEVVLSGLTDREGKAAEFSYFVSFY